MFDNANHIARITIDNEIVTLKLTDKKYGSEINLTNSNKQKLSLLSNNITKHIYKALKIKHGDRFARNDRRYYRKDNIS